MDIERLRQAVIDKRFILSANPDWRAGRSCGLSDDETEQKANDALTIILESIAELVVAYSIDARQSAASEEVSEAIEWVTNTRHCNQYMSGDWTAPMSNHINQTIQDTILTALQQYQPTTRKDQIVEEAAIPKTETASDQPPCSECRLYQRVVLGDGVK